MPVIIISEAQGPIGLLRIKIILSDIYNGRISFIFLFQFPFLIMDFVDLKGHALK